MAAALPAQAKEIRDDGTIVEIVVWALDEPLPPCAHTYKYRLFFGRPGECFVRYETNAARATTGMSAARSRFTASPRWRHCWPISSGT